MTFSAKIGGFMDFVAISGCDTSLYHSHGGATLLSFYDDADREFGICILTYREHPNFQLNYWTRTGIGFRASPEHYLKFLVFYSLRATFLT